MKYDFYIQTATRKNGDGGKIVEATYNIVIKSERGDIPGNQEIEDAIAKLLCSKELGIVQVDPGKEAESERVRREAYHLACARDIFDSIGGVVTDDGRITLPMTAGAHAEFLGYPVSQETSIKLHIDTGVLRFQTALENGKTVVLYSHITAVLIKIDFLTPPRRQAHDPYNVGRFNQW